MLPPDGTEWNLEMMGGKARHDLVKDTQIQSPNLCSFKRECKTQNLFTIESSIDKSYTFIIYIYKVII